MENKISIWESEIAKTVNRLRKELSGKGAKKSDVRICGNVIFCKFNIDLSAMEVNLFGHIQKYPDVEQAFYGQFDSIVKRMCNESLTFIHPDLRVETMHCKTDVEQRASFAILILNKDIEDMIRKGLVKLPNKGNDTL